MAKRLLALTALLTLLVSSTASILLPQNVTADQLQQRYLKLSQNQAGETAVYEFGIEFPNTIPVATISFQICSNNPFINNPCTVPTGLDVTGAVLDEQTGNTGFSVSPSTTANQLILERAGAPADAVLSTYRLSNIINPSNDGSYYVRVQTFQTSYVSGAEDNYGGIAFAITRNVSVTVTVPPYLLFCVGVTINGLDCEDVTGDYVDFGEFSSRQASQGTTQMLAASNAIDGYTIRVAGPTLTSGNNIIPNLVGSDISRPGVGQFGMNLRANSSPAGGSDVTGAGTGLPTNGYNQINFYRFNTGDVVAASFEPDRSRKYTATYLVNVPKEQAPGVYVTTLTYIALGSY